MDYNQDDSAGTPPPFTPVPPNQYPPNNYGPANASGLSDNAAGAISYLTFIPAIIFLVLEPYNKRPFVRFHAFQSIAFSVIAFALHLVLMLIPIIGWIISIFLSLAFLVLWIIVMLKALKGEWYKLPVIGDFALQQSRGTGGL